MDLGTSSRAFLDPFLPVFSFTSVLLNISPLDTGHNWNVMHVQFTACVQGVAGKYWKALKSRLSLIRNGLKIEYNGISINYFVCFRVTLHYVECVMKASYVAELGIVCKTNGFFMVSGGIEVK